MFHSCCYWPASAAKSICDGSCKISVDNGLSFTHKSKSQNLYTKPESGSFWSSVFSTGSFRAVSLWLILGLFGLDLIHLFQTLEKKTYGAMGVYYHINN